ncbi:MAG: hypothetical protein E6K70_17990 [Planctomycetota bacterium]|nr:MAG: hypothetical protein E6K70_17990 [Planctomycetota bacterium]
MQFLFVITLFLSSALLFLIQPMFAKMVLPRFGGTSAVWSTCMVFFQAALLAGYGYAHAAPAKLGVKRHAVLHLIVLLLPPLFLPIVLPEGGTPPGNPILSLLALLAVTVGLPFLVVSASGPLVQQWFAHTSHTAAKDPYFLYAASNLGSMVALLGYPILLEPLASLQGQSRFWMSGYVVLCVLMVGCVAVMFRSRSSFVHRQEEQGSGLRTTDYGLRTLQKLKWVALVFVPSSLMLSVTSYLTTDIAAIPLLWIIPLTLYLLSFTLVFARRPLVSQRLLTRIFPFAILALTFAMLSQATEPLWLLLALHLFTFFVIAMVCHGELAGQRPPVAHLTEYYLWMAVGGVLGGLFNALVAPLLFPGVFEYPLALSLACILWQPAPEPHPDMTGLATHSGSKKKKRTHAQAKRAEAVTPPEKPRSRRERLLSEMVFIFLPGVVSAGLSVALRHFDADGSPLGMALIFGLPVLICFTYLREPLRFGLAIGVLLMAGMFYEGVYGKTLDRERSFYGIHRVAVDPTRTVHKLVHGNTVHGMQSVAPEHRGEPLLYYHRAGPIGQVFAALSGKNARPEVAVVGLGFEIDPTVVHIARDSGYFTYLRDSRARIDIELGDARLTLREAPDQRYDILVLDAFSSDSIPLHLLTRQALDLYRGKLSDHGILAFHVSNGHLDLQAVLGALARDAGLLCWYQDFDPGQSSRPGAQALLEPYPCQWVLMAQRKEDVGAALAGGRWQEVKVKPGTPVWTDDFSNILSIFKWN